MKRVVVVTDFSATGNAALPFAYALADPGAEVHLLHLIEHEEMPGPLYAHYTADELANPDARKKAVAAVERQLTALVPKEAAEKSIKTVVGCALYPDVAEGIVEEARNRKADAVVIGSHGRTGLAHLLLGSVAEQVLRACKLPLFVIPRQD